MGMSFQEHREILLEFLEEESKVQGRELVGIYLGPPTKALLSSVLEFGEQSYHLFLDLEVQVHLPYIEELYLSLQDHPAQKTSRSPRKPGEHMDLRGKPQSF